MAGKKKHDAIDDTRSHHFGTHPLALRLTKLGFQLEPWSLAPGGSTVGLRFRTRVAEIVIRFDSPEVLRVVLYRGLGGQRGAASGFQDFVWLIYEAEECGITHLTGVVSPQREGQAPPMSTERIARFYTRYLGAKKIGSEWGSDVIKGEIAYFHTVWKRRPPPAQPAVETNP